MEYNILKDSIKAVIKENGNGEITGQLLQDTLLAVVNSLGTGYQLMGIYTGEPDELFRTTPDQKVVYLFYTDKSIAGDTFDLEAGLYLFAFDTEWAQLLVIPADRMISITWEQLKELRDNGRLIPGMQYRIIDYVATTTQNNTRSAGHHFDIIVIADTSSKLSEDARATQSAQDEYFADSDLSGWRLRYSLDNDTERFLWADPDNGKGVIYQLIDEFNNSAPFDFKGIQFLVDSDTLEEGRGGRTIVEDILHEQGQIGDAWFYLFSWWASNSASKLEAEDLSIVGNRLKNDEGEVTGVYSNTIEPSSSYDLREAPDFNQISWALPHIIFCASWGFERVCYGLSGVKVEKGCDRLFISASYGISIHIGKECSRIVTFDNISKIKIEDYCREISVGATQGCSIDAGIIEYMTQADIIFPSIASYIGGFTARKRGSEIVFYYHNTPLVDLQDAVKELSSIEFSVIQKSPSIAMPSIGGSSLVFQPRLSITPNDGVYSGLLDQLCQTVSDYLPQGEYRYKMNAFFGLLVFAFLPDGYEDLDSYDVFALVEATDINTGKATYLIVGVVL